MKVSFLIPAHNEEKIIRKTLDNLLQLPYSNYEVLVGLDGCTDTTENIVRQYVIKSKKFKYYALNLRSGKPAVIDALMQKAKGEIIIINDADWIFKFGNKEKLASFFSVFNDKKIGGIAESFPVEWDAIKLKKGNMGYRMVAYGTYFWFAFQKERFGIRKSNRLYVKDPRMFLTNIFRKELYKKNKSLGDDFERTSEIKTQGKEIVFFEDESSPRMICTYNFISIKDLIKQKIRTGVARRQLTTLGKSQGGLFDYHIPSAHFILTKAWRKGFFIWCTVFLWLFITFFGELAAKFRKMGTKEGWVLRATR